MASSSPWLGATSAGSRAIAGPTDSWPCSCSSSVRLIRSSVSPPPLVLDSGRSLTPLRADCHFTYTALITNYGSELHILLENWNFQSNIILIGVTCVVLQSFMSYRIWIVTERRWRVYPALSVALSLAAFVIAVW